MNKDALLRVIKATRMSLRLAEDTRKLLINEKAQTVPDCIAGFLTDALFYFCGERLTSKQDFNRDSQTMKLLTSDLSDGEVTDKFLAMVQQPKPTLISKEEFRELYEKNGGYMTPEGDWQK